MKKFKICRTCIRKFKPSSNHKDCPKCRDKSKMKECPICNILMHKNSRCCKSCYDKLKYPSTRFCDEYSIFRETLRKANQRNREINLTLTYLKDLWVLQKGICPLTGVELKLRHSGNLKEDLGFYKASLDRIDSTKGYVQGNVQFVSVFINFAKSNRTDQEVKEFLQVIKKNI